MNEALLAFLDKYPRIKMACEQRLSAAIFNANGWIAASEDDICDAIVQIIKGGDGSDQGKITGAVNHLAMAHVYLQSLKERK